MPNAKRKPQKPATKTKRSNRHTIMFNDELFAVCSKWAEGTNDKTVSGLLERLARQAIVRNAPAIRKRGHKIPSSVFDRE